MLVGFSVAWGCGPSVSSIYEGNIRFEHCYRLDLDPHIAPTHRKACWDEWSRRYTYGQTRDRLDYARRRIAQLETGATGPLEIDLAHTDGGTSMEGPAPTNAHAPPPPLAARPAPAPSAAAPDAGSHAPPAARPAPPGDDCALDCRESWRACREECDAEPNRRAKSCRVCNKDYGRCVQRCFK